MQPLKRPGVAGTEVRSELSSHSSTKGQNRQWWCPRYEYFIGTPCPSDKCRGHLEVPNDELDVLWCCRP
jgi:hypothetical protein